MTMHVRGDVIMKKVCLLLFIFFLLISINNHPVSANDNLDNDKQIIKEYFSDDYSGYRYPVLPEMSTWPYGNHQKMVEVSQIPEDILHNMTTKELLDTVLCYPLMSDFYAYDDINIGYEMVKKQFNALNELSKREDRCTCLSDFLESRKDNIIKSRTDENGLIVFDYKYRSQCISNILLSSYDFCDVDSKHTEIETQNRDAVPTSYTGLFKKAYYTQTTVQNIHGGPMGAIEYRVLEKWYFSDGSQQYIPLNDFSDEAILFSNSVFYDDYHITPISSPTVKYNCHSYAWYQQLSPFWWINLYNSTGYTSVGMQSANIDGIVVYFNSTGNNISYPLDYSHSARIISKIYGPSSVIGFNLRSKWGAGGLYDHTLENCPYYYYPPNSYSVADRMYYNP